ncbi:MAG: hypothetical protein COT73_05105 [Bdellovibrio sp. CG10_big_fil_rev_8_21_14_0_10_47_8]|nr:MAG: hypothetical protein COT73_05105 [Bdellovibrio sp. CG10_big_fil_rev_8_21_14_0_10_47_8]
MKNQGGQMIVETILLLALLVSVSLLVSKYLQESRFAQKLVGEPWGTLSGMIECGVWTGCGAGKHPNSKGRYLSLRPNQ